MCLVPEGYHMAASARPGGSGCGSGAWRIFRPVGALRFLVVLVPEAYALRLSDCRPFGSHTLKRMLLAGDFAWD